MTIRTIFDPYPHSFWYYKHLGQKMELTLWLRGLSPDLFTFEADERTLGFDTIFFEKGGSILRVKMSTQT